MRVPLPDWRPRYWWAVPAVALAVLAVVATMAVPRWARHEVRDTVIERLEQKTGLPTVVGEVQLGWGRVALRDLRLGGGEDQPLVALKSMVIAFERPSAFSREVILTDMVIEGGQIEGSVAQFRRVATSVRGPSEETDETPEETRDASSKAALPRWVPRLLSVSDVSFRIQETSRDAMIEGHVQLQADFLEGRASMGVWDVELTLRGAPRFAVAELRSDLALEGMRPAFPVRIEFSGGRAPIFQHLAVAGAEGWIEASDPDLSAIGMELAGGFAEDSDSVAAAPKLWSVVGEVRRDLTAGRLRVDMDAFELGRVPNVLERLPLTDSEHATTGGHLEVVFGEGLARLEGNLTLAGFNIDHPTLARSVVRDVGFNLAFAVEADPRSRRLDIVYAEVERKGVKLELAGRVEHPRRKDGRRYDISAEILPVACSQVIGAIPRELIPALQRFDLRGKFDARLDAHIDYARLDELTIQAKVGIDGCRIKSTPPHADPRRLAGGFTHRIRLRNGEVHDLQLYAGSNDFTPYSAISPYMVQAVLTTEDGGFWRHRGFLPSQFEVALKRNLSADQIKLGASTITMQMVKNVLLSHERTLSRKLQEMFLTWYVETAIGKERIIELYLNAIEYGPGIYGITEAARRYFGKVPAELTPPEAAYLALMLPSPVRRHVHYCRGQLSDAFRIKLQRILSIMHERGRLTDLEYEIWRDTPLVFDVSRRGSERACLGRIESLNAGEHTQRALTGLLGAEDDRASLPSVRLREVASDAEDDPSDVDAPGVPAMDDGIP